MSTRTGSVRFPRYGNLVPGLWAPGVERRVRQENDGLLTTESLGISGYDGYDRIRGLFGRFHG